MNKQDLEMLADLIVDKLLKKQLEIDDAFNENLKSMIDAENNTDSTMNIDVKYTTVENKTEDDFVSLHEKKLAKYIADEDYNNAAKTKKILEDYINNL